MWCWQVSEVPRLYRRTNRDTPTRSLPYIDNMLESPLAFHSQHHNHALISQWLVTIFSDITKQWDTSTFYSLTKYHWLRVCYASHFRFDLMHQIQAKVWYIGTISYGLPHQIVIKPWASVTSRICHYYCQLNIYLFSWIIYKVYNAPL